MRFLPMLVMSSVLMVGCATSSPEVRSLAEKTGANVGIIGAQLSGLEQNSREVAELRADNIARLHAANMRLRAQYEVDLELTKRAGGRANIALIDQIRAWGERAAAILAAADDSAVERKQQIMSTQTSLDTRKKALTEIAQGLAELAKEDNAGDRARFLKGFAKQLSTDFDKALEIDTESARAAKELVEKARDGLGNGTWRQGE